MQNQPDSRKKKNKKNNNLLLHHRTGHRAQLSTHIRVSRNEVNLSLRRILVRERIDQLRLTARELRLAFEHVHRLVRLALLKTELRERRDGRLALWIGLQGFLAASLGSHDILLPLVKGKTLVHLRKHIFGRWLVKRAGKKRELGWVGEEQ